MKHGIPPRSRLSAAQLLVDIQCGCRTGFLVGQEMFANGYLGFWGLKRTQFCCHHF